MSFRTERISEDIKREIAAQIRELKDPRVANKFLTVVSVDVSSDASFAKVFVSDINGIESAKEAVKGLECATGRIRREVGKALKLRKTPELKFVADDSVEKGMRIFKILAETKISPAEDEEDNTDENTDDNTGDNTDEN